MNRKRVLGMSNLLTSLLAMGLCLESALAVDAPSAGRQPPVRRTRNSAAVPHRQSDDIMFDKRVEPTGYCDPCDCGADVGCGNSVCSSSLSCSVPKARFYGGFEAVFVEPRFESNAAFTVMQADGSTFESFSDREFSYDLNLSPRAFVGWQNREGVGLRATWWLYDEAAATASDNPPSNGFGAITHPPFGDVDISSSIPTDTFTANSSLNLYTIDLEATREGEFCGWTVGVAGGIRYAFTEQTYLAQLQNSTDVLRGQIDYNHSIEGIGPTIFLSAYRPIACDAGFFTKARGSVLFGNSQSHLSAGEDLDLTTSFSTTRTTGRDDLLSVGEIQLGFLWQSASRRLYRPFLSLAMEGQIWNGAGNASSEDGSLGFFGFNSGAGLTW